MCGYADMPLGYTVIEHRVLWSATARCPGVVFTSYAARHRVLAFSLTLLFPVAIFPPDMIPHGGFTLDFSSQRPLPHRRLFLHSGFLPAPYQSTTGGEQQGKFGDRSNLWKNSHLDGP